MLVEMTRDGYMQEHMEDVDDEEEEDDDDDEEEKKERQLRNAKRSYTCAKHSSLQTVDGATGVVGGGHTMHTYT